MLMVCTASVFLHYRAVHYTVLIVYISLFLRQVCAMFDETNVDKDMCCSFDELERLYVRLGLDTVVRDQGFEEMYDEIDADKQGVE